MDINEPLSPVYLNKEDLCLFWSLPEPGLADVFFSLRIEQVRDRHGIEALYPTGRNPCAARARVLACYGYHIFFRILERQKDQSPEATGLGITGHAALQSAPGAPP